MPDAFADSTERLKQLLARVSKETDPKKYDDLSAEIRRVLDEREILRQARGTQEDH